MDLAALFDQVTQHYKLPADFLPRTAQIESTMNPNARNPRSSAGGLFQFIDSTARMLGLHNRFDPVEATWKAGELAAKNTAYLQSRGIVPDGAQLYLAHQQGAGGAYNLLSNPNAPAVGARYALNGGKAGTLGQFAQQWINKYNGGAGGTQIAGNVPLPPPRPSMADEMAGTAYATASPVQNYGVAQDDVGQDDQQFLDPNALAMAQYAIADGWRATNELTPRPVQLAPQAALQMPTSTAGLQDLFIG